MTDLQLTIPAQDRDSRGIRLKPREVCDWLHNLPYMDVSRTLQLATRQLRLLNRQVIAPAARLEILDGFLRTYQRLAEHTPGEAADADVVQALLKQLSQNISFGYKILVHTLASGKGRFREGRHLPQAMLGAVHTLGQQLLHCYVHHQRVPRAVWSECLAIYRHAQRSDKSGYAAVLADNPPITIDATFRLIALLKLADPYQLRPGMLEALRQYFLNHIALTRVTQDSDMQPNTSVLQVSATGRRMQAQTGDSVTIEVTALLKQMQNDITRLEQHQQARIAGLSPDTPATTLLAALHKTLPLWQSRRERASARENAVIGVELLVDLEAAYCAINRNRPFDPARYLTGSEDDSIQISNCGRQGSTAPQTSAPAMHCSTIDHNSGGLGICYRGKSATPRVGQLLAVRRAGSSPGEWVLGVFRWIAEPGSVAGFDAGLQYLAREPVAVVIRPMDSDGSGGDYQPAISADQKRGEQRVQTLIARGNQLQTGDAFSLYDERGAQRRARCIERLESGSGFDRFIYQLQS